MTKRSFGPPASARMSLNQSGGEERGLEATGGFEPPNRGFADLRLSPLGYVALAVVSPSWCRGRDLNPHRRKPTAPSRPRVYQFHHLGLSVRQTLYHVMSLEGPSSGTDREADDHSMPQVISLSCRIVSSGLSRNLYNTQIPSNAESPKLYLL